MSAKSVRRVVPCVLFVGLFVLGSIRAEDAVPAPFDLDNKDVAAYLLVPDLNTLLDNAEAVVKQVAPPEQFKPGMLKAGLGMNLGDPALANLAKGAIAAMIFKLPPNWTPQAGPPAAALFIPAAAAAPYDQAFQNMGLQTAYQDGVLVAAKTPEGLKKGVGALATYKKLNDAKLPTDARVFIAVSAWMETLGPILQAKLGQVQQELLDGMAQIPPQANAMPFKPELLFSIVKLEFKAAQGFLNQAEALQVDLKVKPDAVTLEQMFVAKPDTLAAEVLSSNAPPTNSNLLAFAAKGFIKVYFNSDSKNSAAAMKKMLAELTSDPDFADLAKNEFVASAVKSAEEQTGNTEGIFSIGFGDNGVEIVSANKVSDEQKYRAAQDKMLETFGPEGPLNQFLAGKGTKFEIKMDKAARKRAGADIDRMNFILELPEKLPPEAADLVGKLLATKPEMAIVKGYALTATNPATLDTMIDKTAGGDFSPGAETLKSMAAFGKNKNVYYDFDIAEEYRQIGKLMGDNNPVFKAFAQMKPCDPLLMAASNAKGRGLLQLQIPLSPILEIKRVIEEMGKAMENGVPKQPDKDNGKF